MLAYQLDSIKRKDLVTKLQSKLEGLQSSGTTTIFLYSLPECLLREPWEKLMVTLIQKRILKLACIDEVHLFVMFGITFRKKFTLLKISLFQHLINNVDLRYTCASGLCVELKVPLLLMTATFNNTLLGLLQKMIEVKVIHHTYLWAGEVKMSQSHIKLNVSITFKRSKEVKYVLDYTLRGNINKEVIIYTNTTEFLDTLRSDIESWLDLTDNIKGDIIV